MSMVLFLVKFFKEEAHAADFLAGKIYCNTLGTFRKMEEDSDSARSDSNEGTTMWLQSSTVRITIDNEMDISADLAAPVQMQMHWLDELNIFCMYAGHTDRSDVRYSTNMDAETLRQELEIPEACFALGDHAVVVLNVSEFIQKMESAAERMNYRLRRELVQYYDPDTFHGTFDGLDAAFWKQNSHSAEQEFRFVIDKGYDGEFPLCLHVGDLTDITLRLPAPGLNGPEFLGGNMSLLHLSEDDS